MVQRYDYFSESEEFEPFDRGEWVKYEDYAALKEAAEKALAILEDYEVQIDGEWGACRDINQLYADGIVADVLPLLKGLLHDN